MEFGIDLINFYGGPSYIDIKELFQFRGLSIDRFDNLMMLKKSVGFPCEDAVTYAVNAAKPIVDKLSESELNEIELLITATESGVDFGKSVSTYVHKYLNLPKTCRLFEVKQACYGGTASLQMAYHYVASCLSPNAKALVIATDVARYTEKMTYAEPSQGAGAVAMLVSKAPLMQSR